MTKINAGSLHFHELNLMIRNGDPDITIYNCNGQRYIGSGLGDKTITVFGTPGNAAGAYLDGAEIVIHGNAQDAVGDTMNDGMIIVNGSAGDALGYAMRGGRIYVKGNSGYRTGIHMKEYKGKKPVIVVGGSAGSFLGEYLAGGVIVVLGLEAEKVPVGNFCGTGMHGGKIYIRSAKEIYNLPEQVSKTRATGKDMNEISGVLKEYCSLFSLDYDSLMRDTFHVLRPNAKNPYTRLYTYN